MQIYIFDACVNSSSNQLPEIYRNLLTLKEKNLRVNRTNDVLIYDRNLPQRYHIRDEFYYILEKVLA